MTAEYYRYRKRMLENERISLGKVHSYVTAKKEFCCVMPLSSDSEMAFQQDEEVGMEVWAECLC